MLVKFIKNNTPYMAGETAGFDKATAERLINTGRAVLVDALGQVKPVPAPAFAVPVAAVGAIEQVAAVMPEAAPVRVAEPSKKPAPRHRRRK